MKRSHHARKWRRPPLSLAVLVVGIALLIGATWQAVSARRTHERTVSRVLQSYAAVAAWNYEQHAVMAFRRIVEDVFHPMLHDRSLLEVGSVPPHPAGILTDRADLPTCCRMLLDAARFAAMIPLRGAEHVATRELEGQLVTHIAAELRRHYEHAAPSDRLTGHELMHAFTAHDSSYLAVYSPKEVPGDTMLYALLIDPARIDSLFAAPAHASNLLPEPLLDRVEAADVLAFSIRLPNAGPTVHGSAPASSWSAERPLPKLGGLVAVAELRPGAEAHLILGDGGLLEGRFLLAMLALAIGLLIVAFSQFRREYALARLRSEFVSNVSHELRTPLALQRVFLDMLNLGRVHNDEKRQWCLDNIDRESTRLAHLVENLLHFSRSEQRTMRVKAQRTTLAPLIADIIRGFEPLAAATHTNVHARLDTSISAPVDPVALRQVLMNLLENAVKYAPGTLVEVSLLLADGVARMVVDDGGCGIPPDEREVVFEPYRRGRATVESGVAGSGIGLAVVRELVRGHGGRVSVSGSPAGGARFTVELPDAWHETEATFEEGGADHAFAGLE